MLRQEFQGKTGLVKFKHRQRIGAEYEIMHLESKQSKSQRTNHWNQVGSAVGAQIQLQNTFWMEKRLLTASRIKVVTIEYNPVLMVSKEEAQSDQNCLLDYPCKRYLPLPENRTSNSTRRKSLNLCCTGFLIDMIHMFAKDLGVTFELYLVEDGKYGSFDAATGQWNGMVKDLIDEKAEMALAALTINSERATAVDFSEPYFFEDFKILISSTQVENSAILFGFLDPFDGNLWIAFLSMINIVLVITWLLEKYSPFGHHRSSYEPQQHSFGITACMSYVWGAVFKLQLDDVMPKSSSARLTAAVFSFATLILTTSYTANLAASIVTSDVQLPIVGIRDPKVRQSAKPLCFNSCDNTQCITLFDYSHLTISPFF